MKKTYTAFAFIFLFSAIPTAEAAEQAATICSIYYETLSACNEARDQESSGSTLTACTYTSGAGYQWCVSGTGSSLNTDLTLDTDLALDIDLTDTDTTTTAVDTVVSCPTGTSLTTDGCCCVND